MIQVISSRFLNWAADHEDAYVALYFAWVVFAWLLFFAGVAVAIYHVWHLAGGLTNYPPTEHTHYFEGTVRRGLDTYVATHFTYTIGGKKVVRFFWVRLPRPGEFKR